MMPLLTQIGRFLSEAGPLIWPIILLTQVIAILTLWNAGCLAARWRHSGARRRHAIDAVLFWGATAAVLGFLGQRLGIHRMSRAIAELGIVSPLAVAIGLAESLLAPVAGMAVLTAALGLWFLLRLWFWGAERRTRGRA